MPTCIIVPLWSARRRVHGGISAIVARPGDKQNRVQVSFAVARRSDNPVTLAPRTPHFVFELDIVTDRARSCSGCNAHAVVQWTSATLFGPSDHSFSGHGSIVLTDSTARVDVNGARRPGEDPQTSARETWEPGLARESVIARPRRGIA